VARPRARDQEARHHAGEAEQHRELVEHGDALGLGEDGDMAHGGLLSMSDSKSGGRFVARPRNLITL
jgi:hypothetical protein